MKHQPSDQKTYITGFALSVALTIAAYLLVTKEVAGGWGLASAIIVLAVMQLFVQLLFFLHLGREKKPRLNLMVLSFAVLVVMIVVIGSIWIMNNLNYNMTSHEAEQTLLQDQGIKK